MKRLAILAVTASAVLAAPSLAAPNQVPKPSTAPVPAGAYTIDKAHTSLVFHVNHMGFSHYTARFTKIDGTLQFDPAHPEAAQITATIDPLSLELGNPPAGFHEELVGKGWLDAAAFPKIEFRSLKVARAGRNMARISGELSLHGQTQSIVLLATYNGGWAGHPMDPRARIGFSAHGSFKRSAFGISYGIPAPGTTMGVGDEVQVEIESELTGPPLATGQGG